MTDGIKLDRNGTSITLRTNLAVQRAAGRPNAELQETAAEDRPKYIDKVRPASDVFTISGVFFTGTPEADAKTLIEDILLPPLGRSGLTLTFENGLFGLGSFTVAPSGTQAGRVAYSAGETGVVSVANLELRVVDNS